jgi:hypothetical protein
MVVSLLSEDKSIELRVTLVRKRGQDGTLYISVLATIVISETRTYIMRGSSYDALRQIIGALGFR